MLALPGHTSEQRTGENQKRPLDRKSPIQVRIHLPPAESRVRTRFLDHGWRRRARIQRGCAGFQIIVLSSMQGKHGTKDASSYSASKWGILGLMKSAAMELGQYVLEPVEPLREFVLAVSRRHQVRIGLVWGFFCQAVVLGCAESFLFGAGKAVFRPVACNQVPGARGRGQGTETLAELGGLPP